MLPPRHFFTAKCRRPVVGGGLERPWDRHGHLRFPFNTPPIFPTVQNQSLSSRNGFSRWGVLIAAKVLPLFKCKVTIEEKIAKAATLKRPNAKQRKMQCSHSDALTVLVMLNARNRSQPCCKSVELSDQQEGSILSTLVVIAINITRQIPDLFRDATKPHLGLAENGPLDF